jgi:transmembrane sensor
VFADQSRATASQPETLLSIEQETPSQVSTRLVRGRARFEVTRAPQRSFIVRASDVTVSVVGTVFSVELVADRVGVWVERGIVDVDWRAGYQRLSAGEGGWFPPLLVATEPSVADKARAPGTAPSARSERSAEPAAESARELLAKMDSARAQGQPERAVELLRRILREHPTDPRAPLAAFTLGRILLTELGRPREAAAAFREVQTRAPGSSFAEDALAREVEAWRQAGESERARALARSYLERYPAGRHVRKLRNGDGSE